MSADPNPSATEPVRVAAVVRDLMDRSRLSGTPGTVVRFVDLDRVDASGLADDLLVVDLAGPDALDRLRAAIARAGTAPWPTTIGFGPHVDADLLAAGAAAGCHEVMPRSHFFSRFPFREQ